MVENCRQEKGDSPMMRQRFVVAMFTALMICCFAISGCSTSGDGSESAQKPSGQAQAQFEEDKSSEGAAPATEPPAEEVKAADKSGLQEAVANAEAVDADGYTEDSYAALCLQLAAAKDLLADDACTQEQVDKALAGLEAAHQSLAVKFDKKNYQSVSYKKVARNPDDYEGKRLKFTGKVVQVIEGEDSTEIRVAIDEDYDDVVYVGYNPAIMQERILEDDTVTVYGTSVGLVTYESTMGGNITIPALVADKITIDEEA